MKFETPTGVREEKRKSKVHPITFRVGTAGEEMYNFTLSLTWALDLSGWSTPLFSRFTAGNEPVLFV